MKQAGKYFSLLIIVVFIKTSGYTQQAISLINAQDKNIQYEGRVGFNTPGVAEIYWPGSSFAIRFKGSGVKVMLQETRLKNFYTILVDGDSAGILSPDTSKMMYTLAAGLSESIHTVQLFRRTAWNGITKVYGFQLSPGANLLAASPKKRMIEFYGNSITVGSGMNESSPYGAENNYLGYAAITARHFNARYSCIARSGIGLMVSWFSMIMPEVYNRLNPFDSNSVWAFSKAIPDIVVIDLFQNDYAIVAMPESQEFKRRFSQAPTEDFIINAYRKFVQTIRGHYLNAHIICVLGNMDAVTPGSLWPGYIEKAVSSLGDKKMYTHFFAYKNTPDHPNEVEHRQMAESLIRFIEENIKW